MNRSVPISIYALIGLGWLIAAGLLLTPIIAQLVAVYLFRWSKSYEQFISPPLAERGLRVVSVRRPGFREKIRDWPFAKVRLGLGGIQTDALGFSGEYEQTRIVRFEDDAGRQYELWVGVAFEAFRFRKIRFRPARGAQVHESTVDLIEPEPSFVQIEH